MKGALLTSDSVISIFGMKILLTSVFLVRNERDSLKKVKVPVPVR